MDRALMYRCVLASIGLLLLPCTLRGGPVADGSFGSSTRACTRLGAEEVREDTLAASRLVVQVIDVTSGDPLADAEVVLTGPRNLSGRTDRTGSWRRSGLPGGHYRLSVGWNGDVTSAGEVLLADGAELRLECTLASSPVALNELVVTAARRPQRLKDVVVPTTLISRHEIEESGASDVASVLATHAGAQPEGGVPAGSGMRLQGLGAQRVLVLLDGEPIVGRVNGNLDLSRLPASIIERIEVVEGPQAVLYGSDALGGVINIVTRAPAERPFSGELDLLLGSRSRQEATGTARGSIGAFGYTATTGHRGVDLAPGIETADGTRATRWDAHTTVDWRASPTLSVNTGALLVTERQRYRTGQLYNFADNDQAVVRLDARWSRGAHQLTPGLSLSRFDHLSRASTGSRPVSGTGERDVQQLLKASLIYGGQLLAGTLDAGVELRRESIRADRVQDSARALHTSEPYVQMTWALRDLRLTPGARLTLSEQWGDALTPRIALLYRPAPLPSLALRASAGRGFRAPDFKELYLNFVNTSAGYAVAGNPDLRPETSTNLALSAEWSGHRLYSSVNLFHNVFRDFIETGEADAAGTYTYENLDSGRTYGMRVELGYTRSWARLQTGYAHLRSREDLDGGPILGNATHTWHLSLAARPASWLRLNTVTRYTGATPTQRDEDGTVIERDPFLSVDTHLSVRLPWSLDLGLGTENLLDETPGPDWPGYTGRRFYSSLSWQPMREAGARE